MTRVKITAATSSCVRVAGDTFTHQHARASGGLKDVIYTLDFEGRALLVCARANRLSDSLCLRL
jgi:hypothetical protein